MNQQHTIMIVAAAIAGFLLGRHLALKQATAAQQGASAEIQIDPAMQWLMDCGKL